MFSWESILSLLAVWPRKSFQMMTMASPNGVEDTSSSDILQNGEAKRPEHFLERGTNNRRLIHVGVVLMSHLCARKSHSFGHYDSKIRRNEFPLRPARNENTPVANYIRWKGRLALKPTRVAVEAAHLLRVVTEKKGLITSFATF